MTSTATLQASQPQPHSQRALSAHSHPQRSRSGNLQNFPRSASNPHPTKQYEKDLLLKQVDTARQLELQQAPDAIPTDPEHKNVGFSSQTLQFSDFELMQTLGTGTFARVWLARFAEGHPQNQNKVFALKVLKKVDVIKLKQVEHVRNERNVLAAVAGHPFITKLLTSFSDSHSLYMLLEYTPGGEIFSYLRRARRFPFATVQFYAAEITLILAFLHDVHHVAYRDLKPENILLDAEGHLKLVDFGFAKHLPPAPTPPGSPPLDQSTGSNHQPTHGAGVTYTLCGTPEYLAPEVIRNSGHGTPVDWWALGILVYEMLIGQPPFWDQNPMRIYEQIVQGHIRFPVASSHHYSSRNANGARYPSLHVPRVARDFILALCKTDPTERLGHIAGGSKRVMQHPFFDGVNWDDIYYRRRKGPIVPKVEWEGDAGNFDEYPDPPDDMEESEGGRGRYTRSMREEWDEAFAEF